MAYIDESDTNLFYAKTTTKLKHLLGVIFLCAGGSGLATELAKAPQGESIVFTVLFYSVFVVVGLIIAFGRRYLYADRKLGILYSWFGIFGIGLRFPYDVPKATRLSIKRRAVHNGGSASIHDELSISPVDGVENRTLVIMVVEDYLEIRQIAEALARYLNISLCDYVCGGGLERQPETLDWSIRQRLIETRMVPGFPSSETSMDIECSVEDDSYRIILSKRDLRSLPGFESLYYFITLMMVLPIGGFILFLINRDSSIPATFLMGANVAIFVGIGLSLFIAFCKIRNTFNGHEEIIVSRDRLVIEQHGLFSVDRKEMVAHEIEELLPDRFGNRIIVRSDHKVISICKGQTKGAVRWVRAYIEHVLCS